MPLIKKMWLISRVSAVHKAMPMTDGMPPGLHQLPFKRGSPQVSDDALLQVSRGLESDACWRDILFDSNELGTSYEAYGVAEDMLARWCGYR